MNKAILQSVLQLGLSLACVLGANATNCTACSPDDLNFGASATEPIEFFVAQMTDQDSQEPESQTEEPEQSKAPQADNDSKQAPDKSADPDSQPSEDKSDDADNTEDKGDKHQLAPRARHSRRGNNNEKFSKQAESFVALFRPVVKSASRSVVQLYSGGKQISLGLVVDADGLILSKASELKGEIKCKLPDGRLLVADVFGIHPATDLVMLKVNATGLTKVEFANDELPTIGQWVATPLPDEEPAVGIVSVNSREIPASTPFIGIQMLDIEDRDGVRITHVVNKSPADEAGLWVNDVIIKLDDTETVDIDTLRESLGQYDPDERITLTVMRGETEKRIKLTLAEKDKVSPLNRRSNQQNSMGSKLSRRRKAFPDAFQHDSMLTAKNCGGPLVNVHGQVIGVNIARAGRVACYSLPAAAIEPVIAELKTGKLAPEIVNQPAIAKIDIELTELVDRIGKLPQRKTELQSKIESDKIRRAELNEILKDLEARLKKQDAEIASRRDALKNVEEELQRADRTRERLKANRKLLSTGRR